MELPAECCICRLFFRVLVSPFSFDQPIVLLTHPGFIKSYFDSLYDEEIITEESFNAWESSSEEERGKGVTVAASSEFFRWLRSAAEEPGEES